MKSNHAFADMFKNNFDFNQLFSTQRRSIEAFSAANQVVMENAQAISRRQAEIARENVEQSLKASKDLMSGGTPEVSLAKNADLAKSFYENALGNLREVSEMATKSCFEAFDILNKRAAEVMDEISSASGAAAPSTKKGHK
jgi:phasin family protein